MSNYAIHAICHRKDSVPVNFRNISPREGVYGSGWWMIDDSLVKSLPGGWLYLHETSGKKSHFVGKIESVGERNEDGRYELIVRKQLVGDQLWRGGTPGQHPKHYFKVVPVSYPHEITV